MADTRLTEQLVEKLAARPRFLVLEGIDGSGTTTHSKLLVERLRAAGAQVLLTHEPSVSPVGKLIRAVLTGKAEGPASLWDPQSMALLFAADRLQHLAREVRPALARGVSVVSDRYLLSSLAYQSATAALEGSSDRVLPWLLALNRHAEAADLTVVLTVPPEVAAERRSRRAEAPELFEADELQGRLAQFYLEAPNRFMDQKIESIDADGEMETVAVRVDRALLHGLE